MRFHAVSGAAARRRTDCAIVDVYESGALAASAVPLDARLNGRLARLAKRGDLRGRIGETTLLDVDGGPCQRVLVVGIGGKGALTRKQYKKATLAAAAALVRSGARDAVSFLSLETVTATDAYLRGRLAAEAVGHALYRVPAIRSTRPPKPAVLAAFAIAVQDRGQVGCRARTFARCGDLLWRLADARSRQPARQRLHPQLSRLACASAGARASLRQRAHPRRTRAEAPADGGVPVGNGRNRRAGAADRAAPPGRAPGAAPIVLVGKGVTFDSGGISLKQPPGMDEMKFDMTGAASVFGAIKAAALIDLPINLIGIVPACENMPSGHATKPGDIVRSMSGRTIEVVNTDAEGRLILCDALDYARRFKPAVVLDVATLTGACVIALGAHLVAVMSNDDGLAAEIVAAGQRAEDRAWHMPMAEEYHEQLKSNFADFTNSCGREGGAITAACFLSKFTEGLRWAHLDIAGVAYLGGAQKGSTGRPVALLVDFLANHRGS